MRRRAKPARAKVQGKRLPARTSPKTADARVRDLEKRLAEALKGKAEALEQRTATSEILRLIADSPADLPTVLNGILDGAIRLVEAEWGALARFDGELFHLVAQQGQTPGFLKTAAKVYPFAPHPDSPSTRAITERYPVYVEDAFEASYRGTRELARAAPYRSLLSLPLLREGRGIGTINLTWPDVRLFPADRIEVLKTFADQAVIAIENVRLFKELEARNRDLTATSEILSVIASSPTDLQPVLDALAESAARLCESFDSAIYRLDGERLLLVANHGASLGRPVGDFSLSIRGTVAGQAVRDRCAVHVPDVRTQADKYPESSEHGRRLGLGTMLCVPMLKEGTPIGVIALRRTEAKLFTDRQISLLQTFADQAVIAIENVRLFTELQEKNRALTAAHAEVTETLEQQTAMAEILEVISTSPTHLQPVLDAVVKSAARFCAAPDASIFRFDGENLRADAHHGSVFLPRDFLIPVVRGTVAGRSVLERQAVSVTDLQAETEEFPEGSSLARQTGHRATLSAPLLREGAPIGVILLRRVEAVPFTGKQIALVKTFADQAVIAIENVRLFTELQEKNQALTEAHAQVTEALEQQTATSEILRVISSSPTDVQPVFDSIAASALRLCDAKLCTTFTFDGDLIHLVASHHVTEEGAAAYRDAYPSRPGRASGTHRAILTRTIVHIPDIREDPEYELRALTRANDYGCVLAVPMLRDGHPVGAITVGREAARPFPSEQIALLKTFADQAVIAIENVRLFTELQEKNLALTEAHAQATEALEQQTATSEVLKVISRSAFDLEPVLETLIENAVRLCGARRGSIYRFDGQVLRHATSFNVSRETFDFFDRNPIAPGRFSMAARVALERRTQHIPDILADSDYTFAVHQVEPIRTALGVPMMKGADLLGAFTIWKLEVQPFTERQIELVTTFADQAVIAIENVRLLKELEARNHDLTEALDKQTATSEILRVISGSQTDVQPVFDTIIQSAVRLLGGFSGVITQIVDDQLHLAALTSTNSSGDAAQKALWPKSVEQDGSLHGHVIRTLAPQATTDVESDRSVPPSEVTVARERGYRSMVAVPLVRDGRAVGSMAVTRRAPGPFADGQVALLQTFADQAVIAIANVRLFKELDARTRDLSRSVAELRALSEVGQAISSTLDLQAVLSTIVARATELSGTDAGVVYEYDEQREVFLPRATEHLEAEVVGTMLATPVRKGEGATGRLAEVHEPIQLADILEAPAESRVRSVLVRAGYRALLAVPLVREDRLIGGLTVIRKATGAFAPEVIELLRTFATQSALAIQNARLFLEIADKSQQLEAASRHKSEFLANMSHELRTPLNAIIGFSEVLMQRMFGELNTKQEEYLKDIYESGRHLLSLINDILDLSKIEAGRMELELTEFDLPTAVESALTLVRERATRRGIALQKTLDGRVGRVQADERKVRQVVLNLLSNAIKFTPEGGRIEIRAVPLDGSVEVSVADTGVGIAPEDQEAVFEEFRQVGSSAAKQEGTGLGLTLSRKFVELHGGTIRVTSAVGAGSTFTFTLPVRPWPAS